MNIEVKLLNKNIISAYENYLSKKENSSIYHTLGWKRIIEKTYRYEPFYLIATNNDNICGILPLFAVRGFSFRYNKLVSIPYSHYVEPLYDDSHILDTLLSKAIELSKKMNVGYIEIKAPIDNVMYVESSNYYLSNLSLSDDLERIFKKIKPSTRRNIKKAEKEGLIVHSSNKREDYKIFYNLMVETRKRQGVPVYPLLFFYNLFQFLKLSQKCLYLTYKDNLPIAGILMLYHGNTAIYGYGASVNDKENLRLRPNELLFWTAIKDAHENGFNCFDFGITHKKNSGLLRFKSQWGAITSQMRYSYFLHKSKKVPEQKREGLLFITASGFLKRLPKTLFKSIGPQLMRILG